MSHVFKTSVGPPVLKSNFGLRGEKTGGRVSKPLAQGWRGNSQLLSIKRTSEMIYISFSHFLCFLCSSKKEANSLIRLLQLLRE